MPSPNPTEGGAITWHSLESTQVLQHLHASANGLTASQVVDSRRRSGYNELPPPEKESPLLLFARQFFSLLMVVLMIAAIVSGAMGEMVEAVAIVVIVVLAAVVGFIQEYKAEQALEALQKLVVPKAAVLRDGLESLIPARELVPGDAILLKAGDAIPADARLLESMNLTIDESMLTGESRPVVKDAAAVPSARTQLGDRVNMVYGGTMIQYGRGTAVVTGTGLQSEFGKIAALLQTTTQRRTPLQENLDTLGRNLGVFSIALAAVMSLLGVLRGYPIAEMFIWGVAIAVAVIPEALPAVMTITLALGVRRMAERKAIIRKLPAVETLGATSVICSDKTGTLTQNEMTVRQVVTGSRVIDVTGTGFEPKGQFLDKGVPVCESDPELHDLLRVALLCNDAVLQWNEEKKEWEILGDPTEGALLVAAHKGGLDIHALRQRHPRVNEIPFSSERKRMTTLHQDDQGILVCSKGAPEMLLDSCAEVYSNDGLQELGESLRNRLLERGLELAGRGLRVLALASAHHPQDFKGEPESGLVFLGMMAMQDPVRPEVLGAIKTCEDAGIRPVMITGDHSLTAMSIGDELGIRKRGGIVTGQELAEMSDEELDQRVETTDIFARIAPEHKLRIVNAFMRKGSVVAMTGDGVNDAPALKRADIGVAMGITGTDVSKEASDMILTNDNFATIVDAIEEGRSIFMNIKKYLVFLLSGNMGTVLALILALLLGMNLPLQAVHVLFINFIMDGLIAISLGLDPPERGIMRRPPRAVKEGILHWRTYLYIGFLGTAIGLATFFVYKMAGERWGYAHPEAATLFFVSLIVARLANAFNCRSFSESAFSWNQKRNTYLLGGILLTVVLSALVVFVPALHVPFQTTPIGWWDLAVAGGVAALVLASGELVKGVARLQKQKLA
jgi:P-type Ca2+ transporter type 2C